MHSAIKASIQTISTFYCNVVLSVSTFTPVAVDDHLKIWHIAVITLGLLFLFSSMFINCICSLLCLIQGNCGEYYK